MVRSSIQPVRGALAFPFWLLLLVLARPAAADCSTLHAGRTANPRGNQLKVITESAGAPVEEEAVTQAIGMWTGTCRGALPSLGEQGNINVRLRFHDGDNDIDGCGNGCACTFSNTLPAGSGGRYLSSSITHLFERHRDGGGDCRAHRVETIAHELGHVLGFRHPKDPYSRTCAGLIMSFSAPRAVQPTDCALVRRIWRPSHGHHAASETYAWEAGPESVALSAR